MEQRIKSIRSLLNIPVEKLGQLACPHLSVQERYLLREFAKFLTPFEEATYFTQRPSSLAVSCIIPRIKGIRETMEKMNVNIIKKW